MWVALHLLLILGSVLKHHYAKKATRTHCGPQFFPRDSEENEEAGGCSKMAFAADGLICVFFV